MDSASQPGRSRLGGLCISSGEAGTGGPGSSPKGTQLMNNL